MIIFATPTQLYLYTNSSWRCIDYSLKMKHPKTFENAPEKFIVYGHWTSVDLSPECLFEPSEVNGAFLNDEAYNEGVKFIKSISSSDGYIVSDLVMTIPEGLKIGEVFDRVPYGIINKTITGLGATTLEIMTPVRNSIIVVPTKTLAYSKVKKANIAKGKDYAMYIGSPIGEVNSNITINHVKEYIDTKSSGDIQKFVVVADSLPMLLNYLTQLGINVYSDYFLMVDEIDTLQSDSYYRPRLEAVMDYYFKFDLFNRAVVSATIIPFSNPLFAKEATLKILWDKQPIRNIRLIYSNYVEDAAVNEINYFLETTQDKILVAYNTIDGIFNIIDNIEINKDKCGILCSDRSSDKVADYKDSSQEAINENGNLLNRVTFMTCAYFAGIDIQDRCHLILISSKTTPYTYLSVNKMTQVAGRGRNGNLSETIIYDIPEKNECNKSLDVNAYKGTLLNRAAKYINFINAAQSMIDEDMDLKPMEGFIRSYMSYISKSKPSRVDIPLTIIRKDLLNQHFVPAYFNIDALIEKWLLRHTLYSTEDGLEKALKVIGHNVSKSQFLISKDEHIIPDNEVRKELNQNRLENELQDLKTALIDWHNNKGNNYALNEIVSKINKRIVDTVVTTFRLLHQCYPLSELIDILIEAYKRPKSYRNVHNAAIFYALPLDDTFKAKILAKFACNLESGKSKCYINDKQRKNIILECWTESFKVRPKTLDRNLSELATSFLRFKTSKGKYCPDGINPKNLPLPTSTLPSSFLTADMFMLPSLKDKP